MDEVDTENMNPEEIYNSIKKTSADIQNLSKMDSQYDELKKERDSTSQDSGIQGSMHDVRANSPDSKDTRGHRIAAQQGAAPYNPHFYSDSNSQDVSSDFPFLALFLCSFGFLWLHRFSML